MALKNMKEIQKYLKKMKQKYRFFKKYMVNFYKGSVTKGQRMTNLKMK